MLSQICSRTIFEINTAVGACLLYAPGALLISNMVLEHIWNQHWSRSMFAICWPGAMLISNIVLEHIWLRIFFKTMVQDHKVLMVQDHMVNMAQDHIIGPKSHKSYMYIPGSKEKIEYGQPWMTTSDSWIRKSGIRINLKTRICVKWPYLNLQWFQNTYRSSTTISWSLYTSKNIY